MIIGDIFAGIFLGGAAVWDGRIHRIPNWWLLAGTVLGGVLAVWEKGVLSAVSFLMVSAVVVLLFFPLFFFRMMGAGDIKVMAVLCGYLGISHGSVLITYGFLAGACFSAVKLIRKDLLFQRFSYFFAYFRRFFMTREVVPYYLASRDGGDPAMPFAVCLWIGWIADVAQRRLFL